MRCLRMPAAFPIDDVGLHNAIKHLLGLEAKPTKKEILRYRRMGELGILRHLLSVEISLLIVQTQ